MQTKLLKSISKLQFLISRLGIFDDTRRKQVGVGVTITVLVPNNLACVRVAVLWVEVLSPVQTVRDQGGERPPVSPRAPVRLRLRGERVRLDAARSRGSAEQRHGLIGRGHRASSGAALARGPPREARAGVRARECSKSLGKMTVSVEEKRVVRI